MKPRDDSHNDSAAPQPESPGGGAPEAQDPLAAGSPRNLVPIAMTVVLLFFAGIVFYLAATFDEADTTRENWMVAQVILVYLEQAIFCSGVLLGLGALATARKGDGTSAVSTVARLLSWGGAAVVILGVAQSVCIVGSEWGGWRTEATQIATKMATAVFEGGVLAGLALLCLRRARE